MYNVLKICDSSDEKITQQIIETNIFFIFDLAVEGL